MDDASISAETIVEALGGTAKVADALSLPLSTVSSWKERGIPSTRWLALVDRARELGRSEITLETLARFGAQPRAVSEAAE